jgi:hypothetical protein
MFVIRLERRSETGDLVSMWLRSAAPTIKWGLREAALNFSTKDEARRVAIIIKISGAWYVEPA